MATSKDIPENVKCPQCDNDTSVSKNSVVEILDRVAVTFSCVNCDALLTINSIDNFAEIDIDDDDDCLI